MVSSSLFWIFGATVLFWVVGAYNRIVRLRSAVVQAFGRLDAHLVCLMALLGEFEAVWGRVTDTGQTERTALQAATVQMGASVAVARARPLDAEASAALSAVMEVLASTWSAMVQASETEGHAMALVPWTARWEDHRVQNALAARLFNDAAQQYNAAIAQFPAQLLAWVFGFKAAGVLSGVQESSS
ncbi:MAG: LemA family protein [Burkholderiaceae bacterium]|nr:LemA family protein [Burkholderiaceae bacterium]